MFENAKSESTAVERFDFNGSEIRTVLIDGEPWFFANDVCAELELRQRDVMSALDEDEKMSETIAGIIVDLVGESGVYSTILRSRKASAKAFKRWITREVLPSIRKIGGYSMVSEPPSSTEMLRQQVAMQLATLDRMIEVERRVDAEQVERRALAERVERLEVTHERYAAIGYAALRKIRTDVAYLNRLGRAAAAIARRDGIPVERVHSTIWGEVNAWPLEVWDEALDQIGE